MPWGEADRTGRERHDPPGWDAMRRETLETDGHRCVWPGRWAVKRGAEYLKEYRALV